MSSEFRPVFREQVKHINRILTSYEQSFRDIVNNYPDLYPRETMHALYKLRRVRRKDLRDL